MPITMWKLRQNAVKKRHSLEKLCCGLIEISFFLVWQFKGISELKSPNLIKHFLLQFYLVILFFVLMVCLSVALNIWNKTLSKQCKNPCYIQNFVHKKILFVMFFKGDLKIFSIKKSKNITTSVFNRPGVAGAVL